MGTQYGILSGFQDREIQILDKLLTQSINVRTPLRLQILIQILSEYLKVQIPLLSDTVIHHSESGVLIHSRNLRLNENFSDREEKKLLRKIVDLREFPEMNSHST